MTGSVRSAEPSGTRSPVVLGLGNVLVGDDGAGLAAMSSLRRRYRLPADVRLLDGGVLGLHLLGLVENAEQLLVLDTVRCDLPPGRLVRLAGDRLRTAFTSRMSLHELGFVEVLAAAELRGRPPTRIVVHGVVPERVEPGVVGLSPAVAAVVDRLADAAAAELRSWGVVVPPHPDPVAAAPYPDDVLGVRCRHRPVPPPLSAATGRSASTRPARPGTPPPT